MAANAATWDYAALKRMLVGERLPAMVVDLDVFEANVRRLAGIARAHGKTLRPASKSLRVPELIPAPRSVVRVRGRFANSLVRTFDGDGGPYAESIASAGATWAKSAAATPSETVGRAIYDAAVDGSWRPRYVVGDDAVSLLGVRASMTDEQFVAVIRERFGISRAGE